ncbi:MAG: carboxypeptidase-like regulatory domain-containing protein, partial [Tannerella sp.]|nr:carboxypeptidase-like regulatory domain-containing protein [Tannerella sp.]
MKRILFLLLVGSVSSMSLCFSQEAASWQSTVIDSLTRKSLPDVHVFAGRDSTGVKSKADGTFRLNVQKGETVRFRKKGYKWLNVEVGAANVTSVELVPATKSNFHGEFETVEVNGALLPEDE